MSERCRGTGRKVVRVDQRIAVHTAAPDMDVVPPGGKGGDRLPSRNTRTRLRRPVAALRP